MKTNQSLAEEMVECILYNNLNKEESIKYVTEFLKEQKINTPNHPDHLKITRQSLASKIKDKASKLDATFGSSEKALKDVMELCEELKVIQKANVILAIETYPDEG